MRLERRSAADRRYLEFRAQKSEKNAGKQTQAMHALRSFEKPHNIFFLLFFFAFEERVSITYHSSILLLHPLLDQLSRRLAYLLLLVRGWKRCNYPYSTRALETRLDSSHITQ